jgi:internalin A
LLGGAGETGFAFGLGLEGLTSLNLWNSKITDGEVEALASLKGLTSLELGGTQVTDDGVKELQKALPRCRITRQGRAVFP